MTQSQTVILATLRSQFEINGLLGVHQQNIWIMALAAIPFDEKQVTPILGNEEPSTHTHTIRLVLRTTDESGTNDYVDGTDVYIRMDNENKNVNLVWEDLWAEGPPIFHGGTIPDALRWVRELAEPFYVQLKDPFLTPEQRIALNGHDEDYIEPTHEQRNDERTAKHLTDDDFDGLF